MDLFISQTGSFLLQGAALGITAAATPGPFQTYLINQTLVGGWRRGAPLPFAPLISDPPIILAVLLFLNQIPTHFTQLISLAGGLFVLFLAWSLWREWRKSGSADSQLTVPDQQTAADVSTNKPIWRAISKGALMNLLSPGPYLFWALVSGPILMMGWQHSPFSGSAFLIGFYGAMIIGMLGLVILFQQTRRLGERVVRIMVLVSIVVLVVFGIILLAQGTHLW